MSFYTYNRWQQLATVNIDAAAIPGFLGAASTDGVLRTSAPLSYADGGDYITLGLDTTASYTFGSITVTEGGGIAVGGTPVADKIIVETSNTDDPEFCLRNTNTAGASIAHEVCFALDESAAADHVDFIGQTASIDTYFHVVAQSGQTAKLGVQQGSYRGELIIGATGHVSLKNITSDLDLVLGIKDGETNKTITWDADVDKLKHSAGLFDFDNDNLLTTGTLGCAALTASGTVTIPTALTGLIRADSGVLSVDTDVTDLVSAASTTAAGKIEIAIGSEVNTGTDATRAVSPDSLDDWTGSAQIATVGTLSSGDVTAQVSAGSTTAAGKVELAIASEVNTGTSTTLAVSPDALAGSVAGTKIIVLKCVDDATAPTVADTAGHVTIPIELNGYDLVSVGAHVYTPSGADGPFAVHIYNLTQTADMLSTGMTIDDTENDTATAGTPAVIDTNNDDVATADVLQIHVTDIGDSATRGLEVRMGFRFP